MIVGRGKHEGGVSRRTWRIISAIGIVAVVVLAGFGIASFIPGSDAPIVSPAAAAGTALPVSPGTDTHNVSESMAVPAGQMAMDQSDRVNEIRQQALNNPSARILQQKVDAAAGGPVLFPADTAMLTPAGDALVGRVVDLLMRTSPTAHVMIVGNTAVEIAEQPLCLQLSQLRAEQVATRMEQAGIDPSRITAVGVSHMQPKDTADQSRRAEFVVTSG